MSTSSSWSTYLDVTQAAEAAPVSSSDDASAEEAGVAVEDAAKVLAAIHDGTTEVAELPAKTGLGTSELLALLASLEKAGLVAYQGDGSIFRVLLTEPTKEALASA